MIRNDKNCAALTALAFFSGTLNPGFGDRVTIRATKLNHLGLGVWNALMGVVNTRSTSCRGAIIDRLVVNFITL